MLSVLYMVVEFTLTDIHPKYQLNHNTTGPQFLCLTF